MLRTTQFEPDALVAALLAADPASAPRRHEVRVVRAPGRINVIGEGTEDALGYVLAAAIDREIRIAYLPTDDGRVELTRLDDGARDGFGLRDGRPRAGTWLDHIAAIAWALAETGAPLRGLHGVIGSSLPAGIGFASSSALQLAAAWAMLGDIAAEVDPLELARICQRAEAGYLRVPGGLMDPFAVACGVAGGAVLLDCRSAEWRPVALPGDIDIVVVHSGAPRRPAGPAGSVDDVRRAGCAAALAVLAGDDPSLTSLRDVTPLDLAAARSRMDPAAYLRAEHVITENGRVAEVVTALEAGDLAAVRGAFEAGDASLRERLDAGTPELEALVRLAASVPGVVASRMTGIAEGGYTVNLVRPEAVDALRSAIERDYPTQTGLRPLVMPVRTTGGAGRLR